MARMLTHANSMSSLALRHRAICAASDFKGAWRTTVAEALKDAEAHQEAHPDHSIDIVTEQTMRMRFAPLP
jgi:hypothetical protein